MMITLEINSISTTLPEEEYWHLRNVSGHKAAINALAMNDDGVVILGADNDSMNFWDYKTGHCFLKTETGLSLEIWMQRMGSMLRHLM